MRTNTFMTQIISFDLAELFSFLLSLFDCTTGFGTARRSAFGPQSDAHLI
jgi:hypothetical protein